MSTWNIIITREIIRGKGMSCSFLLSAGAQNMQARFWVANGLEASSHTTNLKPHEFFDHKSQQGRQSTPTHCRRPLYSTTSPDPAHDTFVLTAPIRRLRSRSQEIIKPISSANEAQDKVLRSRLRYLPHSFDRNPVVEGNRRRLVCRRRTASPNTACRRRLPAAPEAQR
jgi:hypothetical protein